MDLWGTDPISVPGFPSADEMPNPRVRMRWSDSNRRKGNGFKVKGKFNLAFRNKFSTQRKWNRLPKDILCAPSLEALWSGWMGSWAASPEVGSPACG